MDAETRLAALVEELQRDMDTNQVGKHVREVSPGDAADLACALHQEMDSGVAAREAIARRDGARIACTPGCAACCENLIMVWEPEAMAIARYLRRPENHAARTRFLATYPAWRDRVGDTPARAVAFHLSGDRTAYEDTVKDVWRRRVMCAFNEGGACTVYPVRPNVCRNCHAVDTHEHCASDSSTPPQALSFVPLEQFLHRAQALTTALQVTMHGRNAGPASVCTMVYDMLTGSAPRTGAAHGKKQGRNEPCACGSGKKFKRCCGA